MKKDIRIKITGSQNEAGDTTEPEVTEITTTGVLFEKNGNIYIKYKEYMDEINDPVDNLLKFDDDRLELTKKGGVNSVMSFNRDRNCAVHYMTPYGPVDMNIFTEEYNMEHTDRGYNIDIRYSIDYAYEYIVSCGLNVSIDYINN